MNKVFVIAFSVLIACASKADYLYWQVSDDIVGDESFGKGGSDAYAVGVYNAAGGIGELAAAVRYGVAGTDVATWGTAIGEKYSTDGKPASEINDSYIVGDFLGANNAESIDLSQFGTDLEDYSFYIELYRYGANGWYGVARSEVASYTDLRTAGYIINMDVGSPVIEDTQIWQGSGYQIPEPTSGMLVMLGLSLLGLRRKRV